MKNPSFLRRTLTLVGLLAAFAGQASWALAGTSGNIAGIVRDAKTGAPIAGVRMSISSGSQTVSTTTDGKGRFVVFALQPDQYTLTAQKTGYYARSLGGYEVFADQTQQYDLQLDPGTDSTSN
jgi:hypothetical protein